MKNAIRYVKSQAKKTTGGFVGIENMHPAQSHSSRRRDLKLCPENLQLEKFSIKIDLFAYFTIECLKPRLLGALYTPAYASKKSLYNYFGVRLSPQI